MYNARDIIDCVFVTVENQVTNSLHAMPSMNTRVHIWWLNNFLMSVKYALFYMKIILNLMFCAISKSNLNIHMPNVSLKNVFHLQKMFLSPGKLVIEKEVVIWNYHIWIQMPPMPLICYTTLGRWLGWLRFST